MTVSLLRKCSRFHLILPRITIVMNNEVATATSRCTTRGRSPLRQPHPASESADASFTRIPTPRVYYSTQSPQLDSQTGLRSSKSLPSEDFEIPNNAVSKPRHNGFTIYLNICNTILGVTGLVSALCFGVITVAQSDTANEEAKRANGIAYRSLVLSGLTTCFQFSDSSVRTI